MKIIDFKVFELAARCREQFFDARDVIIHAAAHIQQHQDLHVVVALGHHFDIEVACVTRGAGDGVVKIEFKV